MRYTFFVGRRLRDRLVESDRFRLAIEITGKCGLDPGPIWFSLGMGQLKSGKFASARENLGKCLTVSVMRYCFPCWNNKLILKS